MKLLDSDHCNAILLQQLNLGEKIAPDVPLATTAISVAELIHAAQRSRNREDNLARLEVLFAALTTLPFDESAARRCGIIKAELEARGEPRDDLDLQIASIAIENDLILLTNNAGHFERIPAMRLDNWLR
jgi:tRNA(fMet)-specific endonuclease VapC